MRWEEQHGGRAGQHFGETRWRRFSRHAVKSSQVWRRQASSPERQASRGGGGGCEGQKLNVKSS